MNLLTNYSLNNATISMLGNADVAGVQKLEYKVKQEKLNLYGTGGRVVSRAHGKREFEGNMTLVAGEAAKIVEAAKLQNPNVNSLLDIAPFTASVTFQEGVRPIESIILTNVEFLEDGFALDESQADSPVEVPIVFAGIRRQKF